MEKKTLLFANEEIVIAHIVSVKAYERNFKCYVEVKTATREYIEEFEEKGYSNSAHSINLTKSIFGDTPEFQKHFGEVAPENVEEERLAIEKAKERLIEKTLKRHDEILNLL